MPLEGECGPEKRRLPWRLDVFVWGELSVAWRKPSMSRRSFGRLAVTVCAIALGSAVPASAQTAPAPLKPTSSAPAPVSSEPQSTTATFGDWVLRCDRTTVANQPQRVCEVAQTLEAKGQGVVAQITLGRLSGKEPLRLTVALPPNISFSHGVRVAIDDKDEIPADLTWKRCVPGGCVADGDIRDEILKAWRAQTGAGQIRYAVASGQVVNIAFSFRGLAVALDNLTKAAASQ
jgi:invasion protein IalB